MNPRRAKLLGIYLLVAGILQLALYVAMTFSSDESGLLMYLDPRIGLFFMETILRGSERLAPGILRWLSALCIFAIGLFRVLGRPLAKTYVISEVVLLIPNVLFFLFIILANLSPAHGFSIGELILPTVVIAVFSIIPLRLALWARSKGDGVVSLDLGRA